MAMIKFRLFWDLNEEENWINTIQTNGYRLVGVRPCLHCYEFQALTSTESLNPYTRLDFRDWGMKRRDYQDYRQLFNDSGWQLIAGSRHGGTQYFQQRRETAVRDIFSDEQSRQQSRRRFMRYGYINGYLFLMMFLMLLWENPDVSLFNFRSWYLTPGLWQMPSEWFWKALLFETPFVLFRMGTTFIFFIVGMYYFGRAIYANCKKTL